MPFFKLFYGIHHAFKAREHSALIEQMHIMRRNNSHQPHADIRGRSQHCRAAIRLFLKIIGREPRCFFGAVLFKVLPSIGKNFRQSASLRCGKTIGIGLFILLFRNQRRTKPKHRRRKTRRCHACGFAVVYLPCRCNCRRNGGGENNCAECGARKQCFEIFPCVLRSAALRIRRCLPLQHVSVRKNHSVQRTANSIRIAQSRIGQHRKLIQPTPGKQNKRTKCGLSKGQTKQQECGFQQQINEKSRYSKQKKRAKPQNGGKQECGGEAYAAESRADIEQDLSPRYCINSRIQRRKQEGEELHIPAQPAMTPLLPRQQCGRFAVIKHNIGRICRTRKAAFRQIMAQHGIFRDFARDRAQECINIDYALSAEVPLLKNIPIEIGNTNGICTHAAFPAYQRGKPALRRRTRCCRHARSNYAESEGRTRRTVFKHGKVERMRRRTNQPAQCSVWHYCVRIKNNKKAEAFFFAANIRIIAAKLMRIPVRGTVKQCLHRAALTLPAHINTVRRIENTFPVQIMEHRPSAGAKPRIQVIDKFLCKLDQFRFSLLCFLGGIGKIRKYCKLCAAICRGKVLRRKIMRFQCFRRLSDGLFGRYKHRNGNKRSIFLPDASAERKAGKGTRFFKHGHQPRFYCKSRKCGHQPEYYSQYRRPRTDTGICGKKSRAESSRRCRRRHKKRSRKQCFKNRKQCAFCRI